MTSMGWFGQYAGTHTQRELARARRVLRRVGQLGAALKGETDATLQHRAKTLRERAMAGAPAADLMAETFAVVREVSSRQLQMRHFDVQILGGVALHRGNIIEMKTGEGKTLVATLPVVLNALAGKGAHVVTVNDYLAARDARWMAPVYEFMGLSVGIVTEDMDDAAGEEARKRAYQADVTYVTNHELVFDYLRDNLAMSREEQVRRPLNFALVDEVDLLLLDEAGTPLIISGPTPERSEFPMMARGIVSSLRERQDYGVDHRIRKVAISDDGWEKMEQALGLENLAAPEHLQWQHALQNALLAHAIYQRDVDYIVDDGEILLVDDHTGRVSPDKRFSDGLHQALEAKEGVTVKEDDRTLAKVSYQMFFRLYPALCGMTGTAHSAREEFQRTYGLRVIVVPTHRPVIRHDEPAVVFNTSAEKLEAVVTQIEALIAGPRPVLVGTTSVKESEHVSKLLSARDIRHTVLNAKDDSAEGEIIAQAGRPCAVTVSTNMAGRGVDILLGGSPEGLGGQIADEAKAQCEEDRARIVEAGGLMVIGTGLHESRRIDDQLRGRSGRQGEPGGSRFFLSLDDPIYRRFGAQDRGFQLLEALRRRLHDHPRGERVRDRSILRTLRELQKKVEVEDESIRREVLRYDDVVDHQRRSIYGWRQTILAQRPEETLGLLREMIADFIADEREGAPPAVGGEDYDPVDDGPEELEDASDQEAAEVVALVKRGLSALEATLGAEQLAALAGQVMLSTIDTLWTEHLNELECLDDAVGLRGYAQVDPLLEFKKEAHDLYQQVLVDIRASTLAQLFDLLPDEEDEPDSVCLG